MASCFLVYSTDSETKVQTLISIFIIYATGLISILFALPLHMYSESFFHVSDRLEGFSFIAFFLTFFCLGIMNLEEHAAIYAYIPLYILILKPLCILCFDPSGIGFLIKENVYVCCKTWRGREYKGRVMNHMAGSVISLYDLKMKKDHKWTNHSEDSIDLVYINLRSLRRIPCLHEAETCDCNMKEITKKSKESSSFNQNQKIFPASEPVSLLGSSSPDDSAFTSFQTITYV